MPFTLSHTIAVLPAVQRKWFSATGLIIGSMVPDFEYFFRLKVLGLYGHKVAGMFWFDLPLAILLAYAFHYLVKPVLLPNLPMTLQRKWRISEGFDWHSYVMRNLPVILFSIIIGTSTHLLWDAFTHNNTVIVQSIPALRQQVDLGFEEYPAWHLLQQFSSGIGLIVLILYIIRMPDEGKTEKPRLIFWILLGTLVSLIMSWRLYEISGEEIIKIGHLAVVGMGATLYSLLFLSVIVKLKNHFL
ncbi:MAG: DUF4184 family protein [Cyclobacteriaceae bacterium]